MSYLCTHDTYKLNERSNNTQTLMAIHFFQLFLGNTKNEHSIIWCDKKKKNIEEVVADAEEGTLRWADCKIFAKLMNELGVRVTIFQRTNASTDPPHPYGIRIRMEWDAVRPDLAKPTGETK